MSTPHSAAHADAAVDGLSPFGEDVRAGLLGRPKRVPPRWFYDALGSALFEAICRLPWYRITRSETALLDASRRRNCHGRGRCAVVHRAGRRQRREAGDSRRARGSRRRSSRGAPDRRVAPCARTGLGHAGAVCRCARDHARGHLRDGVAAGDGTSPAGGRQLVLFLGSNIGNFDPVDALAPAAANGGSPARR